MDRAALEEIGREIARRTTAEQGLPLGIEDPETIEAIANLLAVGRRTES